MEMHIHFCSLPLIVIDRKKASESDIFIDIHVLFNQIDETDWFVLFSDKIVPQTNIGNFEIFINTLLDIIAFLDCRQIPWIGNPVPFYTYSENSQEYKSFILVIQEDWIKLISVDPQNLDHIEEQYYPKKNKNKL